MLNQLIGLLAGKRFRIDSKMYGHSRHCSVGVCKTVWRIPETENQFYLEEEIRWGGRKTSLFFWFVAETVTADSVEGDFPASTGGHCKIQVI